MSVFTHFTQVCFCCFIDHSPSSPQCRASESAWLWSKQPVLVFQRSVGRYVCPLQHQKRVSLSRRWMCSLTPSQLVVCYILITSKKACKCCYFPPIDSWTPAEVLPPTDVDKMRSISSAQCPGFVLSCARWRRFLTFVLQTCRAHRLSFTLALTGIPGSHLVQWEPFLKGQRRSEELVDENIFKKPGAVWAARQSCWLICFRVGQS